MSQAPPLLHTDPEIMSGVPFFVGTRVPVTTLFHHYLAAGDPLEDFPTVSRDQAVAALGQAFDLLATHAQPA